MKTGKIMGHSVGREIPRGDETAGHTELLRVWMTERPRIFVVVRPALETLDDVNLAMSTIARTAVDDDPERLVRLRKIWETVTWKLAAEDLVVICQRMPCDDGTLAKVDVDPLDPSSKQKPFEALRIFEKVFEKGGGTIRRFVVLMRPVDDQAEDQDLYSYALVMRAAGTALAGEVTRAHAGEKVLH